MPTQLHISQDATQVAHDFTRYLLEQIAGKTHFNIALSGGSTPKRLFKLWASEYADQFDWSVLHFYWGDDRCVPPGSEESNYGVTQSLLFDHVPVPTTNIHRVRGEDEPASEAERYGELIEKNLPSANGLPAFDLIILGMGDDGHTASIFPHQMELLTASSICAVATHPTSGQQRVSLTGPVINNAERVTFLVTGENKAKKVDSILNKTSGHQAYPAAYILPRTGDLHWFLDAPAYGG